MGHLITVATCNLNQWALDFEGNTKREWTNKLGKQKPPANHPSLALSAGIIESIIKAKEAGASLRVGPELEVCGYGCLDHLLEQDLYLHCWQCLETILKNKDCHGILLDIGMPVLHRNNRFNCRVVSSRCNDSEREKESVCVCVVVLTHTVDLLQWEDSSDPPKALSCWRRKLVSSEYAATSGTSPGDWGLMVICEAENNDSSPPGSALDIARSITCLASSRLCRDLSRSRLEMPSLALSVSPGSRSPMCDN